MGESAVKEWLLAAQKGDWAAYQSLERGVLTRLYGIAYRILRSAADAEEAVLEVRFRAYIHRADYDPRKSASAWLIAVMVHYCLSRVRGNSRHPKNSIDEILSKFPDTDLGGAVSNPPTQEAELSGRELRQALEDCWSKLTDLQRVTLAYSAFERQKPDLPDEKIYNNANKARESLRKCLRKAGHEFRELGI